MELNSNFDSNIEANTTNTTSSTSNTPPSNPNGLPIENGFQTTTPVMGADGQEYHQIGDANGDGDNDFYNEDGEVVDAGEDGQIGTADDINFGNLMPLYYENANGNPLWLDPGTDAPGDEQIVDLGQDGQIGGGDDISKPFGELSPEEQAAFLNAMSNLDDDYLRALEEALGLPPGSLGSSAGNGGNPGPGPGPGNQGSGGNQGGQQPSGGQQGGGGQCGGGQPSGGGQQGGGQGGGCGKGNNQGQGNGNQDDKVRRVDVDTDGNGETDKTLLIKGDKVYEDENRNGKIDTGDQQVGTASQNGNGGYDIDMGSDGSVDMITQGGDVLADTNQDGNIGQGDDVVGTIWTEGSNTDYMNTNGGNYDISSMFGGFGGVMDSPFNNNTSDLFNDVISA